MKNIKHQNIEEFLKANAVGGTTTELEDLLEQSMIVISSLYEIVSLGDVGDKKHKQWVKSQMKNLLYMLTSRHHSFRTQAEMEDLNKNYFDYSNDDL